MSTTHAIDQIGKYLMGSAYFGLPVAGTGPEAPNSFKRMRRFRAAVAVTTPVITGRFPCHDEMFDRNALDR